MCLSCKLGYAKVVNLSFKNVHIWTSKNPVQAMGQKIQYLGSIPVLVSVLFQCLATSSILLKIKTAVVIPTT